MGMMPDLLILFMFVFAFGPGYNTLIVAMTLPNAFGASRVIRGVVLREKQSQYVEAGLAMGAGHWRIMLRHLLPNVLDLAIVSITIRIGGVILAESALSFLGLGIPPPAPRDFGRDEAERIPADEVLGRSAKESRERPVHELHFPGPVRHECGDTGRLQQGVQKLFRRLVRV